MLRTGEGIDGFCRRQKKESGHLGKQITEIEKLKERPFVTVKGWFGDTM